MVRTQTKSKTLAAAALATSSSVFPLSLSVHQCQTRICSGGQKLAWLRNKFYAPRPHSRMHVFVASLKTRTMATKHMKKVSPQLGTKKYFSLSNRLFYMLDSVKKRILFAKSTFFHAGQREKILFFTLKLLFFTLELLFFLLDAAAG
jgi:hypothetical protein